MVLFPIHTASGDIVGIDQQASYVLENWSHLLGHTENNYHSGLLQYLRLETYKFFVLLFILLLLNYDNIDRSIPSMHSRVFFNLH